MKYFISPDGNVHAYESDGSQDHLIREHFVPATPEQVQTIQNPPPPPTPPKWAGVEFGGVMCSATAEDQNGLAAVLATWQLQGDDFQPTLFRFSNRNTLRIDKGNIREFMKTWTAFRQGFFAVT